jgi:hypothetical protein
VRLTKHGVLVNFMWTTLTEIQSDSYATPNNLKVYP